MLYERTSEYSALGWDTGPGGTVPPSRYDYPGLLSDPVWAYLPRFDTQTRMTQDARVAADMGQPAAQTPVTSLVNLVGNLFAGFRGAADELMPGQDRTWRDPDTGDVYSSNGARIGRAFDEVLAAGGNFIEQAKGLFNVGYSMPPGYEPTTPAMKTGVAGESGIGLAVVLGIVLLVLAKGVK